MVEADVADLRDHGYEDGAILEINQVTAYFNYANRTVLGLGVTTDGDILGLSPNHRTTPTTGAIAREARPGGMHVAMPAPSG